MRKSGKIIAELFAILLTVILFIIPFYFILINSFKNSREASKMNLQWPNAFQILDNYREVIQAQDYMLVRAFFNSAFITVASIIILVFVCAMAGFIMQRRKSKPLTIVHFLFLAGLMIPPAVVPTIWVLNGIGMFKTMAGLILIEVAINIPFAIILYSGFVATIPREIDEAALVDGAGSLNFFFRMIMPLLKPVTSTIIVLTSVNVFNDFVNPLYFLPGAENATAQLTLYNFMSLYNTSYNLLFADVVLLTVPPLILFLIFNKRIVAGMTAGAVKG
ncbi:carbohydrate ABC transporter permease [Paenibacillus woosongensis]|uniref:ABC transporter permease subunit n=1 Tax=Paenibacillus woosongensis TaxID=307580 RepID=A0A7X3CMW4_9BACL|nr:carbohydrate ABC transporter permease [Paenibacillus woosongensis]MUG45254.1 ABC transporter permease subunit [Paenibacillus woosongensis]